MEVSGAISNIFHKALNELKNKSSYVEKQRWLNHAKRQIRLIHRAIKKCNLNHGTLIKFQTDLAHIKRFQTQVKVLLKPSVHLGRGLRNVRSNRIQWQDTKSFFGGRIRSGVIINLKHIDVLQFLEDAFFLFKSRIINILKIYPMIKINTIFCGEFVKQSADEEIHDFKYFHTPNAIVDLGTEIIEWFREHVINKIMIKLDKFQEMFSGWSIVKILNLEIHINKMEQGNRGSTFIRLPSEIASKQACVNIKNDDEACFAWAVTAALYPVHYLNHPNRTSSYLHYSKVLDTSSLEIPMSLSGINKFEKRNNISINVYILELRNKPKDKQLFKVCPARLTQQKLDKHVNLLMIQNRYFPRINDFDGLPIDDDNEIEEIKFHYVWIKDLSRLVSRQLSRHKTKKYICDRCLNYFSTEDKLIDHTTACTKINNVKIRFPKESFIEFKNFAHKELMPFIIYADFESMLIDIEDNATLKTFKYQEHVPFSVGYYFKCSYDNSLSYFKSYRADDCLEWFCKEMENIAQFVQSKIKNIVPMVVTPNIEKRIVCHICEKRFDDKAKVVRDHNHFNGEFRGLAHEHCNLNYKKSFVVPIVFHNLSGYDGHFIIKHLAKNSRVSLLPINKEKYISFTQFDNKTNIQFRFIDSFKFLAASLDELTSTLEERHFKNLKHEFSYLDPERLSLLMCKGVFPYDYINNIHKLNDEVLPERELFYNKLNDSHITKEEYIHASLVWNSFGIKNLGEYSDLYLKTDVMLLVDVFENFRTVGHTTYGLDPAHYFTLPGYTWNCMLKYTKCKLDTIQDVDMLFFIEQGIRGGISQCSNRMSQSNNKYMSNFDPSKPSTYLIYLDVNNLYGWAMTQYLPYGGFKWYDSNLENFDVTIIPDDANIGYFLEVDLEYPSNLHNTHNDLPFLPEHRIPPGSKIPKLMTTLYNKERYIVHYRNLKQAIQNGLVPTKIHRILQFNQSPWLKPYIDLNTKLRAQASTVFSKNNYKLMNNAVFGKTMENIRKHRIVKLVNRWGGRYGAKNLIASPSFHNRTIFEDGLMAIELNKTELVFNKPLYIGQAILDISKTCVYDFHYSYMLKKFQNSDCKLLYTDTDSLIYEIKCNDFYVDILKADSHMFDTSDYPSNNRYGISLMNKKIPGLLKDELNGNLMTHFVGLRSKMYTFMVEGGARCVKKSKGVKYNIVKNKITFQDYVKCLNEHKEKNITQRYIKSFAHKVYSIEQSKIALNPNDDKRYINHNTCNTLAWGHYSIKT